MLMHESEQRGKLMLNGKKMDDGSLAQIIGLDKQILTTTLTTLLNKGVASLDSETGALMCRRMVRDEELRKIRQISGKLGGNPALVKQNSTTHHKQNGTTIHNQNPTPSSSSSSSPSGGSDSPIFKSGEFVKRGPTSPKLLQNDVDTLEQRISEIRVSEGMRLDQEGWHGRLSVEGKVRVQNIRKKQEEIRRQIEA